jgi:hypothetical protein
LTSRTEQKNQTPYPIPKIQNLLLKLEGFKYGTSLDLNMGYYHIELSDASKQLCTITTQWGKYEYQRLPMGLCNSPDIFQEKMSELLDGLDTVRCYIEYPPCDQGHGKTPNRQKSFLDRRPQSTLKSYLEPNGIPGYDITGLVSNQLQKRKPLKRPRPVKITLYP